MILVDSSVWIDYFNGVSNHQTDTLDIIIDREIVVVGNLILLEVLQGFKSDHDFNTAKKLFDGFLQVELTGFDIIHQAANNYRLLRKKGIRIRKTMDTIIATYCIQKNIHLLHNDKDFEPFVKYFKLQIV